MLPENQSWMHGNTTSSSAYWTRVQDKLFEQALVIFPEETGDRWRKIAAEVPGKTEWEVRRHYEDLVHDVREIESGRVELPCYADDDGDGDGEGSGGWDEGESKKSQISFGSSSAASKTRQCESERKKGTPWTEEEHKLFLIGLQKYGKGDWRSISRNAVVSRTPTQVASHAQKYYLRLNSGKKEKRRSSIHDITTVEDDPLSQHNHQNLVPQFHTPMWQKVQTTMPATTFPHRGGADSSSVYQQQFGFPM